MAAMNIKKGARGSGAATIGASQGTTSAYRGGAVTNRSFDPTEAGQTQYLYAGGGAVAGGLVGYMVGKKKAKKAAKKFAAVGAVVGLIAGFVGGHYATAPAAA